MYIKLFYDFTFFYNIDAGCQYYKKSLSRIMAIFLFSHNILHILFYGHGMHRFSVLRQNGRFTMLRHFITLKPGVDVINLLSSNIIDI